MRAGVSRWQLLELAGWSGLQACFGGAYGTSNASLDLVVSRDEAWGALMLVSQQFCWAKICRASGL